MQVFLSYTKASQNSEEFSSYPTWSADDTACSDGLKFISNDQWRVKTYQ